MRSIPIRCAGVPVPVRFLAGESITLALAIFDPDPAARGARYNLTGKAVVVTLRERGCCGGPISDSPPVFCYNADIGSTPPDGDAQLPLDSVITAPLQGEYAIDVWVKNATDDDDNENVLPPSQFIAGCAVFRPEDDTPVNP